MQIKQFENKNLSHYSYAIRSTCERKIILVDPSRDIQPYLNFAEEHGAEITGVIETHPHADFVSGHLELHQKLDATIYTSKDVQADYPHQHFDQGQTIQLGKIKLTALNTPGHSPDGISILLEHEGVQKAVFTGDTLFIGDCGRPDLREGVGKIKTTRTELARMMYHSLRDQLMKLEDQVIVYPAHGAGTLCGKNLSKESSSTIAEEKKTNWSLQEATEEEFIQNLLADQPFIPRYFPFDVELNRKGAAGMKESLEQVKTGKSLSGQNASELRSDLWIIDTRSEEDFKQGHLPHSINLMENGKFETWLGSIIKPEEQFYLVSERKVQLNSMLERVAAIGYENQVAEGFVITSGPEKEEELELSEFTEHQQNYTIVDVRNTSEVKAGKIFKNSIAIPLGEIRNRVAEIPTDKPIVVHCAGGYRSAAASSIIDSVLDGKAKVYDLGDDIKKFQ